MSRQIRLVLVTLLSLSLVGCGGRAKKEAERRAPRPVRVMVLQVSDASRMNRQAGTVSAWKTEAIAFEVSGRVTFVAEEGTPFEAQVDDKQGKQIRAGSQLATVDPERYELTVASVKAQIETAKEEREAARIEADDVLPAEKRAKEANMRYAQAEMDRREPLLKSGAVSKSEYERDVANRDAAAAKVAETEARRKAKKAEITALDASIKELEQTLAEAEKDVADCALFSPFPGQIARVHVIPGAFVDRGEKVVTAQMMDPITVEVEVSAETARRVNYRDIVPLYVSTIERLDQRLNGSIYTIDPVADAQTRTFTLTILLRNERLYTDVPDELKGKPVVRTREIRRAIDRLPGFPADMTMTEVGAIHRDGQGPFLWKIENRRVDMSGGQEELLRIKKLRIIEGENSISFLGLESFREIKPAEGEKFDTSTDLFVGELELPEGVKEPWDGDRVLFDRGRWLLRPGDIVGVDLSGKDTQAGFYVPMSAISKIADSYAVLAVQKGDASSVAKRIAVDVFDGPGTLKRIKPLEDGALQPGMAVVVDGVHYVQDGESVNVVEQVETQP